MTQSYPDPPDTTVTLAERRDRWGLMYFILALALAIAAGVFLFLYLEDLRAQRVPMNRALVAVHDLEPGTQLDESAMRVVDVPPAACPACALTDSNEALGRVVDTYIPRGGFILPAFFESKDSDRLAGEIPEGCWAMVIPSSWLVGPLPAAVNGDRVDIAAYLPGEELEGAAIIAAGVRVLDVDDEQANHITLAVSLEQMEALLYSRSNGFALLIILRPSGG